ncbi:MAG: hypothetical protein M3020_25420 [Myxococcota bacterium]|jgi:hypothetical protein|nr:hypothetical protein [Myxococcota bacterium]
MLNRLRITTFSVILLGAPCIHAQAASEATAAQVRAAADAFDRGREAYKSGDAAAAGDAFEQADSQAASPIALEYAIRSRDKAGQLDRAATLSALAKYRHPDEAALGQLADEVLERARRELYELSVTCSEACELVLDGKLIHGKPAFERVLFLNEGSHTLRAGFGARDASRSVEASSGERGEVRFDAPKDEDTQAFASDEPERGRVLEREPESRPVEPEARESNGWSPAVFWVGTGLTVALGAATLWSGLDTVKNPGEDKVKEACSEGRDECQTLYDDGRSRQSRTNLLLGATAGVGIITVIIGAAATDWGDAREDDLARRQTKRAKAGIEPWLSVGSGALVGAEGRF